MPEIVANNDDFEGKSHAYRPVSPFSLLSKLFEKLLLSKLQQHLNFRTQKKIWHYPKSTSVNLREKLSFERQKLLLGRIPWFAQAFDKVLYEGDIYKVKEALCFTWYILQTCPRMGAYLLLPSLMIRRYSAYIPIHIETPKITWKRLSNDCFPGESKSTEQRPPVRLNGISFSQFKKVNYT